MAVIARRSRDQIGGVACGARAAVDALDMHGYSLQADARVHAIGPLAGLDEIQSTLHQISPVPTLLGVASLRTLGAAQTEALDNLVVLTSQGWRVASSTDLEIHSTVGFHHVRAGFDRAFRFRETEWVDDPFDRDGLTIGDRLINSTVDAGQSDHGH